MEFDYFDSLILGLIQGLTEFLPISSSGHLVITRSILKIEEFPLIFDVFVHFATLLSVIVFFKKELQKILVSIFNGVFKKNNNENSQFYENRKLIIHLTSATIPAVIIGLLFEEKIKNFFISGEVVSYSLMVTGVILLSTKFIDRKNKKLTAKNSFVIGLAQAFALIPGISRSGSTISCALWLGIKPVDAVKFSFFMAIPVILGANILEFSNIGIDSILKSFPVLLVGGISAFLSGLIAINIIIKVIENGNFFWFGIYCIFMGLTTVLYF